MIDLEQYKGSVHPWVNEIIKELEEKRALLDHTSGLFANAAKEVELLRDENKDLLEILYSLGWTVKKVYTTRIGGK